MSLEPKDIYTRIMRTKEAAKQMEPRMRKIHDAILDCLAELTVCGLEAMLSSTDKKTTVKSGEVLIGLFESFRFVRHMLDNVFTSGVVFDLALKQLKEKGLYEE